MTALFWILSSFLAGSLPFSVWVGKLALGKEIQQYGDKNPGATNVWRAGGLPWFIIAMMLDISKGAAPVGLAYQVFGLRGWAMAAVALAPPLGHAFSPFLGGRGGKAIAATFGVWIGLTLLEMPLVALVALGFWFSLVAVSGWAVMLTLLSMLAYLMVANPDPVLVAVLVGQLLLLGWTHRLDLQKWPQIRPFWQRLIPWRNA